MAPEPRPLLLLVPRTHPASMQTKPLLEPATSTGVILPETGQFLLLCSLQLWQQLQHCHQTRARVPLFSVYFTFFLRKHFTANNMKHRRATMVIGLRPLCPHLTIVHNNKNATEDLEASCKTAAR